MIVNKLKEIVEVPKITLAFSLIKNAKIDLLATKATELGVRCFQPLITQRTVVNELNFNKFQANIKEACEQSNRNDFPMINATEKFEKFLNKIDINSIILVGDETGNGEQAKNILPKLATQIQENNMNIILFIGPEGGFVESEFKALKKLNNCHFLNFGPRILRSDTAIIAGLTLIQEFIGDFNLKPNFYE